MGVLDELKKQAENTQKQRQQQENAGAERRAELKRKLVTRVDDLYYFFKEFEQQLNVVNPNVTCSFDVGDLCTLTNLTQGEYKLRADDVGEVTKFRFYYSCVGSGGREVKLSNLAVAEKKQEVLKTNQLKFKLRDERGGRCSLLIEAFVPVSFDFSVDVDKAVVRLRVKNKPMLGVSNYSYNADQINSEFMDEVAKYILDKPNRFNELSGNTMSEDTLTELRRVLAQDKAKSKSAAENRDAGKERLKDILTKPLFGKKS